MAAMIWTEYLPGFECKTQHIAGRKNVVADDISRTPEHLDDATAEEQEESSHCFKISQGEQLVDRVAYTKKTSAYQKVC